MHWISIIFSTLMPEVIDREHKCSDLFRCFVTSQGPVCILRLIKDIQSCYEKTKYAENKAKVTV